MTSGPFLARTGGGGAFFGCFFGLPGLRGWGCGGGGGEGDGDVSSSESDAVDIVGLYAQNRVTSQTPIAYKSNLIVIGGFFQPPPWIRVLKHIQ
jgi:hypothetical protein